MTSSLALSKRKEMGQLWMFGDQDNPLGGWEDHYITPLHTHECHPNYKAIPIGNKYGFGVCVKRKGIGGRYLDQVQFPVDPSKYNGYHRYSVNLYDPNETYPVQEWNPQYFSHRRMPLQSEHIRDDVSRLEMKYNGTGIEPVFTPGKVCGESRGWQDYGYSYTQHSPAKYDITRLQQAYPVWKKIKEYNFGEYPEERKRLDAIDQAHYGSIV